MKVRDLIQKLSIFNGDAEVLVVVACEPCPFSITCGSADGGTAATATDVSFTVDERPENTHFPDARKMVSETIKEASDEQ